MSKQTTQTMTVRERFQAVMNFQQFDRLPVIEWASWWKDTLASWHQQGLPQTLTDRYDIVRHFGLDLYLQAWILVNPPEMKRPSHGTPMIANMDDYERLRPQLFPAAPIDEAQWRQWAQLQKKGEAVLWFTLEGFFWTPRLLMGIEPHLYAFYDQPELIHRINNDLVEYNLRVIDCISQYCVPDFMTFAEDLSYNHGPMLSKAQFDEFLTPYYQRIVPRLRERGIMVVVDSDGDIAVPAKWFDECGIEGILPLERQSGVDVAGIRSQFPRMRFVGGFNKLTMHKGEDAMRAEFERLLPTAAQGGYLISCDHQTPPQVSYDDYKLYLGLFQEYAQRAGELSGKRHVQ